MSTWETRELPVLRAIEARLASGAGRGHGVTVAQMAKDTGMSAGDIESALRILAEAHGPYVSGTGLVGAAGEPVVTSLTERAISEIRHDDTKQALRAADDDRA